MSLRAELGAPDPRFIEIDGVRLAYSDVGSGPALVCLHAIGHGAGDFARVAARFRDRHRVIALDWPGQGRSDPDRLPASAARYQALLGGFLDGLGVERAVVLGNSIGGATAMRLAAAQPERVRGLVLANPGGLFRVDRVTRLATRLMSRFFGAGTRGRRWFAWAFARYYRMVLSRGPSQARRDLIVRAGYELAPVLEQAWWSFGQPEEDLRGLAPAIQCPVLFAWARRDRFNRLGLSRAAIAQFPDASLELFDAGHAPQLETPDEFETSLDRFLARLDEAGRIKAVADAIRARPEVDGAGAAPPADFTKRRDAGAAVVG